MNTLSLYIRFFMLRVFLTIIFLNNLLHNAKIWYGTVMYLKIFLIEKCASLNYITGLWNI